MFYSTLLLAASALVGLVRAQNTTFNVNGPYTIDPNTVPIVNRTSWCNAQRGNCPLVCGGHAFPNNCSTTDLSYTCTCTDGSKPNISSFANMIPYFECITWVKECVTAAGNDLNLLTNCRSVACGSRDPGSVKQNGNGGGGSPSSSAAPSSSASSTSSGNGKGGSTPSSSSPAQTSTGAAVALSVARNYGTPILAAGMLGLFGFAL